ncbi:MAG TPA: cytochrome c [Acidobacteriota bacterium]|nr:cytochrome c [Acidobacteriota bacterium]
MFTLTTLAFLLVLVGSTTVSVRSQDAAAEKVYKARCASCHGDDLKADTKAGKMTKTADLTVESNWKGERTPEAVEKVIREGIGKMPAFESKLSDEEIQAVAAYTLKLAGINK